MIRQTQPGSPTTMPAKPGKVNKPGEKQEERKPSPQEESLVRQKDQIDKRLQRLQKNVVQAFIKKAQDNPNADPMELYGQISPTLDKIGLESTMVERNKTQLVIGKTNAQKDNMYKILLRRNAELTASTAADINRSPKNFESIIWTSKGMEAFVWGPYAPPAEENVPEGEATPGGTV